MPMPSDTDRLDRFLLPHAGVRGVRVHLRDAWAPILASDDYPPAIAAILGQAAAAAALFTANVKVDGRLSVQLRGQGPLNALMTECTAGGDLRGLARFDHAVAEPPADLRELAGADAMLAITIENPGRGREPLRYQGLVEIAGGSLAAAFESYFARSEQLPTRLLLTADDRVCAGLMLQKLPGDAGDEDGWNRAGILFDTLRAEELRAWNAQALLQRLFASEQPQLLEGRALRFGCSCSRERVAAVLESLGRDEAMAATEQSGQAEVRCEFCGQRYCFTPAEIDGLFTVPAASMSAPDRLQ